MLRCGRIFNDQTCFANVLLSVPVKEFLEMLNIAEIMKL